MNFSELPPSKQWAALKHGGVKVAEVWFKPDDAPFGVVFRIPRESFELPSLASRLTAESLLKSVGIAVEEVESWRHEGAAVSDDTIPDADLKQPLPAPPTDVAQLHLHVSLNAPSPGDAKTDAVGDIPEEQWQALEARWNAILGIEASVDTLRISMEGLLSEMDGASRRSLNTDEKVNALNADVAQWNKSKSRLLYSMPKLREYIHRATWAAGTPERKKLGELFDTVVKQRIVIPNIQQLFAQLEMLLKDRQVLSSLGVGVYQECKSAAADAQTTLRTLQGNAASNATKKRGQSNARGKSLR